MGGYSTDVTARGVRSEVARRHTGGPRLSRPGQSRCQTALLRPRAYSLAGKKIAARPERAKAAFYFRAKWWRRRDSNSRPPRCERDALPTELLPHYQKRRIVYQTADVDARGNVQFFKPCATMRIRMAGLGLKAQIALHDAPHMSLARVHGNAANVKRPIWQYAAAHSG